MELKLTDVSQKLKVPYNTLHHLTVSGAIPAHRSEFGKGWRVQEDDLPAIRKTLKEYADPRLRRDNAMAI